MSAIAVQQFTDVLCVWAYACQVRVDQLIDREGDAVEVSAHFCNVFGDTGALADRWADRGGLAGYAAHVRSVCERFEHVTVHEDAWAVSAPRSSLGAHIFLAAFRVLEAAERVEAGAFDAAVWRMRQAFFAEGRNIGLRAVQFEIAEELAVPVGGIEQCLADSGAHVAVAGDYDLARKLDVRVSPTLVLNEGRQRLAGNVGYRIIEANVRELARAPGADDASWC